MHGLRCMAFLTGFPQHRLTFSQRLRSSRAIRSGVFGRVKGPLHKAPNSDPCNSRCLRAAGIVAVSLPIIASPHCAFGIITVGMPVPTPIAIALMAAAERLVRALVANAALLAAAIAARQRMLTPRGLRHAVFLGLLLWTAGGLRVYSLCFGFLILGSLATRIGRREKEARGIAEKRGGARGPENLWGAAGAAAFCAVVAAILPPLLLTAGTSESIAQFVRNIANIAYVAAMATKMSDTLSSEIGKAYGGDTFLLTTFQKVPRGTEGGVSVEGTLAGVVGSAIAAFWAHAVGLLNSSSASPGVAVFAVVTASFIATTAESIIGATIQRDRQWSNEFVNFVNTTIGAFSSILIVLAARALGLT